MIRKHAGELRALLMLVDGLMAVALMIFVSAIRFGADWSAHWRGVVSDPLVLVLTYAVGWVTILSLTGMYRPRARWTIRSEAVDLLRATLILAAVVLAILFWVRLAEVSRTFLVILFPTQWFVALVTRVAMRVSFRQLRSHGYNRRFMIIVGGGDRGLAFGRKVEAHRELGLEIRGYVADDVSLVFPLGWKRLGPLDDIQRILNTEVIDEVAICLPFSSWDKVDAITQICEDQGKIVRVPMDVLDRAFASGRVEDLDGTPVYSLVTGPDRVLGMALKRLVDLAGGILGVLLLSPILVGVAVAIRLMDGSPVLFRQRRVGLHGRPFTVVKFRTMTRDAEDRYMDVADLSHSRGPAFKMDGDPRVTRLGRFLRRTSLDELPQLWNVLRGEMSLVGPRPAPQREVDGYDLWHRRRLSMKPGITGLWQVTARRSNSFDERAELDLAYIDRWSFWLDLKILVRTIPAAFEGRSGRSWGVRLIRDDEFVARQHPIDASVPLVFSAHELPTGSSQPGTKGLIDHEPLERKIERLDVFTRNDDPGDLGLHDLWQTAHVGDDDRQAAARRFDHRHAEAFAVSSTGGDIDVELRVATLARRDVRLARRSACDLRSQAHRPVATGRCGPVHRPRGRVGAAARRPPPSMTYRRKGGRTRG